jgi:hypothetical protein
MLFVYLYILPTQSNNKQHRAGRKKPQAILLVV